MSRCWRCRRARSRRRRRGCSATISEPPTRRRETSPGRGAFWRNPSPSTSAAKLDEEAAADYYMLASVYSKQGDYASARKNLLVALDLDKKIENSLGIAKDLSALGIVARKSGDAEAAFSYLQRAYLVYTTVGIARRPAGPSRRSSRPPRHAGRAQRRRGVPCRPGKNGEIGARRGVCSHHQGVSGTPQRRRVFCCAAGCQRCLRVSRGVASLEARHHEPGCVLVVRPRRRRCRGRFSCSPARDSGAELLKALPRAGAGIPLRASSWGQRG